MRGLLPVRIVIGSLGVLGDVTVTRSTAVTELARADPDCGYRQLYRAVERIGRAHIASVINIIVLAYAGASLPLMLLFAAGNKTYTVTGVTCARCVNSVGSDIRQIRGVALRVRRPRINAARSALWKAAPTGAIRSSRAEPTCQATSARPTSVLGVAGEGVVELVTREAAEPVVPVAGVPEQRFGLTRAGEIAGPEGRHPFCAAEAGGVGGERVGQLVAGELAKPVVLVTGKQSSVAVPESSDMLPSKPQTAHRQHTLPSVDLFDLALHL
jgi:copper chaperone CopZ